MERIGGESVEDQLGRALELRSCLQGLLEGLESIHNST
jgi:hypothetical protein